MNTNFKIFSRFPEIKYGISQKPDGAMELADSDLSQAHNRLAFFAKRGIDPKEVISPRQCHSANVVLAGPNDIGTIIPSADGLITKSFDVMLTVTVADCFPVYFFNPVTKSVGLAHSGWRGTAANIAGEVIKKMPGSPADIVVCIGPGIGPCHFEIHDDILEQFSDYPESVIHRANKTFIDLPKIISSQLNAAGVQSQNIENFGECTFCEQEKYFSFRRDKPEKVQAMIAYIAMKS